MTEIETVNKIAEILGSTGSAITSQYTFWFVISAIRWMVFGLVLSIAAVCWKPDDDAMEGAAKYLRFVVMFIGALIVFGNVADISAPKAAAIHQLISDFRG